MSADLLLPSFYELQADEAWAAIDFISDIHLNESEPQTFEAWCRYLRRTKADAVFILGDLFEVWIGDDAAQSGFAADCVDMLEEAAARVQLAFMVGNRDFLLGSGMRQRTGMTALADPTRLMAWGQAVLLTHGDLLCTADTEYQAFRHQVRTETWQQQFLAQSLEMREQQARSMRQASRDRGQERHQAFGQAYPDIDSATAVAWMLQAGCRSLVHGHTHRPGTEVLAPGYTRYVLTDWDLKAPRPRGEVLRLTRNGFARLPLMHT